MKILSLIVALVSAMFLLAYSVEGAVAHGMDYGWAIIGFTVAYSALALFFYLFFKPRILTEQHVWKLEGQLDQLMRENARLWRESDNKHIALEAANKGIHRLRKRVYYWRNKAEGRHDVLQSIHGDGRSNVELSGSAPAAPAEETKVKSAT